MIVCSCNRLSDAAIRACLNAGPHCPRHAGEVYACLGCSPRCGKCARTINAIMQEALAVPETHACHAAEACSGCEIHQAA